MFAAELLLLVLELELLDRRKRADERYAAARNDALFDGSTRGVECIFHARLLLLHLGLGSSADLDDCNAADELRETLLELLLVVVGRRVCSI